MVLYHCTFAVPQIASLQEAAARKEFPNTPKRSCWQVNDGQ
jgi:hypothetical protein